MIRSILINPEDMVVGEVRPGLAVSPGFRVLELDVPDDLLIHDKLKLVNGVLENVNEADLTTEKLKAWALIKASRDALINSPLTTPYGVFDADEKSRRNLTDAILLLQTLDKLGTPSTITYVLHNNVSVELTSAQLEHVGILLGQRTQEAFASATAIRQQINAATSISEIPPRNPGVEIKTIGM